MPSGFSYPNFSMSAANGLSPGVGGGGGKMRRERTRVVASKPQEKEVRLCSLTYILKYLNILKFIIKSFDAVMRDPPGGPLEG